MNDGGVWQIGSGFAFGSETGVSNKKSLTLLKSGFL